MRMVRAASSGIELDAKRAKLAGTDIIFFFFFFFFFFCSDLVYKPYLIPERDQVATFAC